MRNRVRALRVQAKVFEAEKDYAQMNHFNQEADKLEIDILTNDILFYVEQYQLAMESGNKSDLVNVGRLLRKKQMKLEGLR